MPENAQLREHLPLAFPETEADLDRALNSCSVGHARLTDDWNALVAVFGEEKPPVASEKE